MYELKRKTIRGGLANLCGQGTSFVLRLGFIITLARFLDPADFGLVAMVTAVTGIYGMFTSAGLADAAVQIIEITNKQVSALFWCNILFGAVLSVLCLATAPILVSFYHEPRLFWGSVVKSAGLLISRAGTHYNPLVPVAL